MSVKATLIRAKVLVNYLSPIDTWNKAISLLNEAAKIGKIEYKEIGFIDSVQISLASGLAPSSQSILAMNKCLDQAGIKSLD